ncbi:MAG: hypothetical protein ABSF92_01235 [Candidatus Acidiferrales bacterium]|jgi:hypothetical protein
MGSTGPLKSGTRGGSRSLKRALTAASDDANGTPGTSAVTATTAAPTRDAYAAAAASQRAGGSPRPPQEDSGHPRVPGDLTLIQDPASFANAVFVEVDPIAVAAKLLKSEDERISQRQLERMLDLKFGKSNAPMMEDAPRFEPDIPRPNRQ